MSGKRCWRPYPTFCAAVAILRKTPVARHRASSYIVREQTRTNEYGRIRIMRAEAEKLVEEIKQSVELLRRHL
jgi:hypothetical protein